MFESRLDHNNLATYASSQHKTLSSLPFAQMQNNLTSLWEYLPSLTKVTIAANPCDFAYSPSQFEILFDNFLSTERLHSADYIFLANNCWRWALLQRFTRAYFLSTSVPTGMGYWKHHAAHVFRHLIPEGLCIADIVVLRQKSLTKKLALLFAKGTRLVNSLDCFKDQILRPQKIELMESSFIDTSKWASAIRECLCQESSKNGTAKNLDEGRRRAGIFASLLKHEVIGIYRIKGLKIAKSVS